MKKNKQRLRKCGVSLNAPHKTENRRQKTKKGQKKICKDTMTKTFPNSMKNANL
jgi:hypothetical protein